MWNEVPRATCGTAMERSCLCTGGTAIARYRQAATSTRARASTCWNLITPTLCSAIRLCSFTSTTLAEEEGRGKDGRQVMVSVAGCHPALVLPDGHCCVTEPWHNSASSSLDVNWFLCTPFFPTVPGEKGSCDCLVVPRQLLFLKLWEVCSMQALGWAFTSQLAIAQKARSGSCNSDLLCWYKMKWK